MSKFKVGDTVRCVNKNIINIIQGSGWEQGKVFIIDEIRYEDYMPCYWDSISNKGVYEPYLELVNKKIENNIVELKMIEQLAIENDKLKKAGSLLAQRAIYTVANHDGLHRLALATAKWVEIIANEGRRENKEN